MNSNDTITTRNIKEAIYSTNDILGNDFQCTNRKLAIKNIMIGGQRKNDSIIEIASHGYQY